MGFHVELSVYLSIVSISASSNSAADLHVLEEQEVRCLQNHHDKVHDLNVTVDNLEDFSSSIDNVLESLYIGTKETLKMAENPFMHW